MSKVTTSGKFPKYESYKDSGVEWLGAIPSHWSIERTKYCFSFNMGQSPDSIDVNTEKIGQPFLQGNAEFGTKHPTAKYFCNKPKKTSQKEDLLISVRAPVGQLNISNKEYVIGRGLCALTINNKKLIKQYAWYSLHYFRIQLNRLSTGSTYDGISSKTLGEIILVLPPLEEQQHISNFLDQKTEEIDQAIAKKQRLIELLKEQKAILINQAVTKGLNPNTPMRDSGVEWIGEIPEHWKIKANRVLFTEMKNAGRENLPILTVSLHTGVSDEEQNEEENVRAKIRIEDKSSYKHVQVGDIAFNMMRAWQGAIGAVKTEGMVSPAYIVARPVSELDTEYFEFLYRTQNLIQQMNRFSKGITEFRKRLYWNEFKQMSTIVPPVKEQKEIALFIRGENNKFEHFAKLIEQQISKLTEYKSTLIANAVTGKIRI